MATSQEKADAATDPRVKAAWLIRVAQEKKSREANAQIDASRALKDERKARFEANIARQNRRRPGVPTPAPVPSGVAGAPTPTAAPAPAPVPTAAGQPWNRPANGLPGGQFAPGAGGQGFSTVKPGGTAPAPGAPPQAAGGVPTPPVGAAARAPGTGAPPAPGFPGVKPIVPPRTGLGTQMGTAGMR